MGNELSKHIEQAQKTGVLQLRNFKLAKVPPEVIDASGTLRTVDLSHNRLQQLPPQLFTNMKGVKTLNMSNNRIDVLPNEISCLVKLETLNLNENKLTQVAFAQLKQLKQLHLSRNALAQIPREICVTSLTQLDHVDLSGNRIEKIDDYISELQAIELNLNENQIRSISPAIAQCPRLKVLRLEQNVLETTAIPRELLAASKVSLLCLDGNLFTEKELQHLDGYDKYMERYTATKRKFD